MMDKLKSRLIKSGWIKFDAVEYWDHRYAHGGDSGEGSKGERAKFKAEFLNRFVEEHELVEIVELGCGDGMQLQLARYPRYTGYDISKVAIQACIKKFEGDTSKKFEILTAVLRMEHQFARWDLALSLDVLYHIIEEPEFEIYLKTLFHLSGKYVIIYAPDQVPLKKNSVHIKYRKFSEYIKKQFLEWELIGHIPNKFSSTPPHSGKLSYSDFFIYRHV